MTLAVVLDFGDGVVLRYESEDGWNWSTSIPSPSSDAQMVEIPEMKTTSADVLMETARLVVPKSNTPEPPNEGENL